jgi:hypothetical protein
MQYNEASSGEPYPEDRWDSHMGRLNTIYRFATIPHASEANYE